MAGGVTIVWGEEGGWGCDHSEGKEGGWECDHCEGEEGGWVCDPSELGGWLGV